MDRTPNLKLNAVLNIIKQCCNILFPLITYPYVSRVLGAANLGQYSFSESFVQYFILLAGLGIPTYAIREGARIRNDKAAIEKFCSELFSINVLSLLASLCIELIILFNVARFNPVRVIILLLTINAISGTLGRDWINAIYEDYIYLSIRYSTFQILAAIFIFIFVKTPDDLLHYVLIMVFANSGGYILNIFYTQRYVPLQFTLHFNAKKHLKPVLLLFTSSIAVTIYIKSDITMLGFLDSDQNVGIYTLTSKIYSIVKTLLNALITVSIPRLSLYLGAEDKNRFSLLAGKLRDVLYTFVLPAAVGLFMLSADVIRLIGGQEYISGYKSLQLLSVALIFAVFGAYYSQAVLIPMRFDHIFTIATIASAIINITLNLMLIPKLGIDGAAITTVIAECVVCSICKFYFNKYIKISIVTNRKNTLSILLGCIAIAGTCIFYSYIFTSYIPRLIASILASVLIYVIILFICKNDTILWGFHILNGKRHHIE